MRHPSKSSKNWPSSSFKSYLCSCTEARLASCHMEWELAISKLRLPIRELARKPKILGIQPLIPHIKAGAPIRNKERTRMPYWLAMNKAWWGLPLSGVPAKITMTKILVTSAGNAQNSCMILTCIQLSPNDMVVGKEFLCIKKAAKQNLCEANPWNNPWHTQRTNFARGLFSTLQQGPCWFRDPTQWILIITPAISPRHREKIVGPLRPSVIKNWWASGEGPTKSLSPRWCMFFSLEGRFPFHFGFSCAPMTKTDHIAFWTPYAPLLRQIYGNEVEFGRIPEMNCYFWGELTARFYLLAHHLPFENHSYLQFQQLRDMAGDM